MSRSAACRWDRTAGAHLLREHTPGCRDPLCPGCLPCDRACADDPCEDCRLAVPPTDTYHRARAALRGGETTGESDG